MNNQIKTSIILFLIILLNISPFIVEAKALECVKEKWYELYKCRVKNICLKQEYWKNKKKVTKLDKFYEKDISSHKIKGEIMGLGLIKENNENIQRAKKLYRQNQNTIYRCSLINSQISVFEEVKKTINSTDKTGLIKERVTRKLERKKEKLKKIAQKDCILIHTNSNNKKQIKKIVLDQSTLELCNYRYYLEYLNSRAKNDIKDSFPDNKDYVSSKLIEELVLEKRNEIKEEIKTSLKVYPLAFDSYIQYDSFFKMHIILGLLKEDYSIFRDKLYLTLHPINQLVYKIINAQSR